MKRLTKVLVVLVLAIFIAAQATVVYGWIGDSYSSPNIAFTTCMQEMKNEQGYDYNTYTYTSAPTYNLQQNLNGYVYSFCLDNETNGFILMINLTANGQDCYEVTEVYVDAVSPFANNSGLNIYVTYCSYVGLINGQYIDLSDNIVLTQAQVESAAEVGFGFEGGTVTSYWAETINYATRTITSVKINVGLPAWTTGPSSGTNTCAVIAGTVVIGYWDMFKTSLIPDYTPANVYNGNYYWKTVSTPVIDMGDDLYSLMGTNQGQDGTTITGFKNGIEDYAQQHGNYSVTYTSAMSWGSYDISKMITAWNANNPVVLFMNPYYNFTGTITTHDGPYDTVSFTEFTGSHTMVTCGRDIYTYKNSVGETVREITFLKVAGCSQGAGKGWLRLNEGNVSINDAFSVLIN